MRGPTRLRNNVVGRWVSGDRSCWMSRNGVGERGGRCNLRSRSRDDVAAFISATLLDPDLNRTAIQVTAGDIRVHEALFCGVVVQDQVDLLVGRDFLVELGQGT